MSYNKKIHIVRDSQNRFLKFYIQDKNLILEKDNVEQITLKKDILNYSLDIDKSDRIHIVYFNSIGELKYFIYESNVNEIKVLKVNYRCGLRDLTLKIIDSTIHMFYTIDSLQSGNSYIYYSYFFKNRWINNEFEEIYCSKYACSYFIDSCDNNIYILYCSDYSLGKYNIKKLDINDNVWEDFETHIIIKNATSLNFFIAPNNIAIVCFTKFINNNLETLIRYRNFNNLNCTWSLDISVSNNNNIFKPVIFYKNSYIYIMWQQKNRIVYKKSNNLVKWSKEFFLNGTLHNLLYLSNIDKDLDLKLNEVYIIDMDFLYSIIDYKIQYVSETLALDKVNCSEPIECIIEEKDCEMINFNNELQLKDKKVQHLVETNSILTNKINDLYGVISKYEDKLQKLKVEQTSTNEKYSEIVYKYENIVKYLKNQNETLFIDTNNKIKNLLKIIEEKENMIQKLLSR